MNESTKKVSKAAKKINIRGRAYSHRHGTATSLLRAGVPPHIVAGRLGHANASGLLDVYAHVLDGDEEAARDVVARLIDEAEQGPQPFDDTA